MVTALVVVDVQRTLVDALEPARRTEFLRVLAELIDQARVAPAKVR